MSVRIYQEDGHSSTTTIRKRARLAPVLLCTVPHRLRWHFHQNIANARLCVIIFTPNTHTHTHIHIIHCKPTQSIATQNVPAGLSTTSATMDPPTNNRSTLQNRTARSQSPLAHLTKARNTHAMTTSMSEMSTSSTHHPLCALWCTILEH